MENLLYRIEILRQRMHEIPLKKSISYSDALMYSQRLDELLNEFYNIDLIEIINKQPSAYTHD